MEPIPATRSDWETYNLPEKIEHFKFKRHFSQNEVDNLRVGFVPSSMEEKWFYYFENNILYLFRSWSGFCIFEVSFDFDSDIHTVKVNRDPDQYRSRGIKFVT